MLLLVVLLLPNVGGAAVVVTIAVWILPLRTDGGHSGLLLLNMLVVAGYVPLALAVGVLVGGRFFRVRARTDDAAADRLRTAVLRAPLRLALLQAWLWAAAVVVFFCINVATSWRIALQVLPTVALGGIVTVAIAFRLVERVLRYEVQQIFASSPVPSRRGISGVVVRTLGGWSFGTAAPLFGVIIACAVSLIFGNYSSTRLAVVVLILAGIALLFGGAVIALTATSVAAPVVSVRRAMHDVEEGHLDVDVDVFDTTELGQLQAGFNRMAAGLREREHIRDLFGRQVGEDVAKLALDSGLDVDGEIRDVAVLFVDLIGSTRLAATREPTEVVTLINAFLGVVIDVVDRHGGWINKFQGDAALAVFGAPSQVDDPAGSALEAARELARRLADEVFDATQRDTDDDVGAGIGVSYGPVVAGRIGDHRRYEYTVIGDPVNEGARLCELAKELRHGTVGAAASGSALDAAARPAADKWHTVEEKQLRGRTEKTVVAVPVDTDAVTQD